MATVVVQSNIPPDIIMPTPRDKYDEEMQRAIREYLKQIYNALNNVEVI